MNLLTFLAFTLSISLATAGFQQGSGIYLDVPPMGSVGKISGKVWGLAEPASQWRVLVLDSGACAIYWDKGHNMNRREDINSAGIPLKDDWTFELTNWDADPADATAPRFAALVVDEKLPLEWPTYIMENFIIHDYLFEAASTWIFVDRSHCVDPIPSCGAAGNLVSWIPQRPRATPVPGVPDANTCDKPPQLPVGLPCPRCVDSPGAPPPAEPIPFADLLAASGNGALPASPSLTPSPTPAAMSPAAAASPAIIPPPPPTADDDGTGDAAGGSAKVTPSPIAPSPSPLTASLRGSLANGAASVAANANMLGLVVMVAAGVAMMRGMRGGGGGGGVGDAVAAYYVVQNKRNN